MEKLERREKAAAVRRTNRLVLVNLTESPRICDIGRANDNEEHFYRVIFARKGRKESRNKPRGPDSNK